MKHLRATLIVALLALMTVTTTAQETALADACVTDYDAAVDYFPDKAAITDADNLTLEYFNSYKVMTVTNAFDSAEPFTYVLVQCGTPAPDPADFPAATQFIEIPTGDVIALQTTQLPMLSTLGLLDKLVGLDSFTYVSSPEVRAMAEAGELTEVGFGSAINVEVVLDIAPEMVITSGFNPDTDAHPVLLEAGIFTALDASWRESSPLGRAEWLKFTAAFYNREAEANAAYDDIVSAYEEVAALAATIPDDERPTVLWNRMFADMWTMPGAATYVGYLTEDAGGTLLLAEDAPNGSANLSFEAVYDAAYDADVWLLDAFGVTSLDGLLAEDPRYADFTAFGAGNVWNNDRDVNENGGNNYYELGVTNPHLVLQDLVALLHPELLPEHEFAFFRPLPQNAE